jgi:hypothetical protein
MMSEHVALCAWGRSWPSSSRTQGAKLAGGKRAPEDDEMRRASCGMQVCRVASSLI